MWLCQSSVVPCSTNSSGEISHYGCSAIQGIAPHPCQVWSFVEMAWPYEGLYILATPTHPPTHPNPFQPLHSAPLASPNGTSQTSFPATRNPATHVHQMTQINVAYTPDQRISRCTAHPPDTKCAMRVPYVSLPELHQVQSPSALLLCSYTYPTQVDIAGLSRAHTSTGCCSGCLAPAPHDSQRGALGALRISFHFFPVAVPARPVQRSFAPACHQNPPLALP